MYPTPILFAGDPPLHWLITISLKRPCFSSCPAHEPGFSEIPCTNITIPTFGSPAKRDLSSRVPQASPSYCRAVLSRHFLGFFPGAFPGLLWEEMTGEAAILGGAIGCSPLLVILQLTLCKAALFHVVNRLIYSSHISLLMLSMYPK